METSGIKTEFTQGAIQFMASILPKVGLNFGCFSNQPCLRGIQTIARVFLKLHFRFSGEIKLGAIFPIHKRGDGESNPCGKIQREDGIQPLEAMLFTLDEINHKSV